MANIVQLDLFINEAAQRELLEERQYKKMMEKSVRGLYARYNELEFTILEMHKRIERLNEHCFKG